MSTQEPGTGPTLLISLWKLRQEDHCKYKVILHDRMRHCLNKTETKTSYFDRTVSMAFAFERVKQFCSDYFMLLLVHNCEKTLC